MRGDFLYSTSELVIVIVFLGLILAACETGFLLGRRLRLSIDAETRSQIGTVEAAILGVLALLLGFSVSMAVTRFETRKQLVLEEANAIGTAYSRTQLLPPSEGSSVARLICSYVEIRVRFAESGDDPLQLENERNEILRLQNEFWQLSAAYGQENPIRANLLLQSLNQAIDLEAARWMAMHDHVPPTVVGINAIVTILATNLVGFVFGLTGRRSLFPTIMLAIAITLVLGAIIDLDRPSHGLIRVSQQPMIDLRRQLEPCKQ